MPAPLTACMRSSGGPPVEPQRGLGERAALGDVPARGPVVRRGDGQPQRGRRRRRSRPRAAAPRAGCRGRRRAAACQAADVRAAHALVGAVEQLRERPRVAVAHGVARRAAARARTRASSRASAKRSPSRLQQAVVGERGDPVERIRAADQLGRLEREAAGEDAEPREQPLRLGVEQLVAPADRAAQRLLARRRVARTGGQQVQPPLEPLPGSRPARGSSSAPRRARSPAGARRGARRSPRATAVVARRSARRRRGRGGRTARPRARRPAGSAPARARRRSAAARGW